MTAMSLNTSNVLRKNLIVALIVNTIWINLSEVFRYFVFVMPMMRESLPQLPNVAPMNLPVFLIWGVWDTILVTVATGGAWLMLERFGNSTRVAVMAGTTIWLGVFVILWLGLWNMNLATLPVLAVALPLALLEMIAAALIVRWAMTKAG